MSEIDVQKVGAACFLATIRAFFRMDDGRVNIPDVFRVGYGLGRKGGAMPVQ